MIPRVSDRRVVTYGFSPQADVRAVNMTPGLDGIAFDVAIRDRKTGETRDIVDLHLPMYGQHNVQNALAAIAIANEMNLADADVAGALAKFGGVKRRFTKTGTVGGITVIDDYGHHPVEIAAVLAAARDATTGKVIAVVQPHRYSRLRDLFEDFCTCFNDADAVVVAPVHAAGEAPIDGIDRDALIEGLKVHGHRNVVALDGPDDLARIALDLADSGDFVVCLGAGTISQWANALPEQMQALGGGLREIPGGNGNSDKSEEASG
jgi:UDP-N-acetylmuramate--alanine ligase